MRVGSVTFDLSTSDYAKKTSDQTVILFKNRDMLEVFASVLSGTDTHDIPRVRRV